MGFTGILAVIFVFMAGAYRTLQMRWPGRWGPILPVWAHSNLSLAAAAMVAIHLGVGARDLNPLAILTWIAAGLFVVSMLSGSYGLVFTTIPSRRRNWIKFHRTLTNVFYVAILPHILIRSFGVWTAIPVSEIVSDLGERFNPATLRVGSCVVGYVSGDSAPVFRYSRLFPLR